jgi:hypothetical protein
MLGGVAKGKRKLQLPRTWPGCATACSAYSFEYKLRSPSRERRRRRRRFVRLLFRRDSPAREDTTLRRLKDRAGILFFQSPSFLADDPRRDPRALPSFRAARAWRGTRGINPWVQRNERGGGFRGFTIGLAIASRLYLPSVANFANASPLPMTIAARGSEITRRGDSVGCVHRANPARC